MYMVRNGGVFGTGIIEVMSLSTGCPKKNQAPKENIIKLAILIQMLNPLVSIVPNKYVRYGVNI